MLNNTDDDYTKAASAIKEYNDGIELLFNIIELIFLELWEVTAVEKPINGLEIQP